jgi:hypothetical protein
MCQTKKGDTLSQVCRITPIHILQSTYQMYKIRHSHESTLFFTHTIHNKITKSFSVTMLHKHIGLPKDIHLQIKCS